uniref:Protein kinase domain-containing protein n=1 Tax=Periophthalmus magnuspinnatus TaxID=409849 RepID=A0A3B4AL83_9GOBI
MDKPFTFPSAPSECVEAVTTGSTLLSGSTCYKIESFLGKGSFGNVAKCVRIEDGKTVAVKMIKNQEAYIRSAKQEVRKSLFEMITTPLFIVF